MFVERLLGLHLTRQQVERGRAFVDGVSERAGQAGVNQLLDRPGSLPTPAEMDAPGLWLARLELAIGPAPDAATPEPPDTTESPDTPA